MSFRIRAFFGGLGPEVLKTNFMVMAHQSLLSRQTGARGSCGTPKGLEKEYNVLIGSFEEKKINFST